MKEGGTFFMIVVGLLALCCGYIYSQGGSPFALAGSSHTPTMQGGTDYHALARQDAIDNGINPDLFERQINQESGFNPNAYSSEGAVGIAQILPSTAAGWHVDPRDPVASLSAAAKAMAWYQNKYGSYEKALACYNAGCSSLVTAMAEYGSDWKIGLPSETQTYIKTIMG